jgi:hypothetical protein
LAVPAGKKPRVKHVKESLFSLVKIRKSPLLAANAAVCLRKFPAFHSFTIKGPYRPVLISAKKKKLVLTFCEKSL